MRPFRNAALPAVVAALFAGALLGYAAEAIAAEPGSVSADASDGGSMSGQRARRSVQSRESETGIARRSSVSSLVQSDTGRHEAWSDSLAQNRLFRSERRLPSGPKNWRDIDRPSNVYALHGSIVHAIPRSDFVVDDVHDGGGSSFVTIDPELYEAYLAAYGPPSFPSDSKVVDVETERLDRRPVAPGGIEITYTGGAKIIRIAPDYDRAAAMHAGSGPDRRALAAGELQPWSAGWLRHCTEAYGSFDPTLGTYVAADGRVRFCEGSR